MARGKSQRMRSGGIAVLLIAAVCAFLVLSTLQQKYGFDFGLPEVDLPSVTEVFGETPSPASREPATAADGRGALSVHFLDVGQGESILIVAPDKVVLIDAGETNQGDGVIRYLHEQGVNTVDLLIGTHPHSDHIGGLPAVIRELEIGDVLLPQLPDDLVPGTAAYTRLLEAIADKALTITPAETGDTYDLGDGALLTVLGPVTDYDDLNNMSIVCRLDYGSTSFLFTGDAEQQAEEDLVAMGGLAATVLSCGHHGSKTSTTLDFLQAVSPKVAVISCGLDNSYGHPHREVMERLQAFGIRVLRTDLDGAVVLLSDGESIGIQVENSQVAA